MQKQDQKQINSSIIIFFFIQKVKLVKETSGYVTLLFIVLRKEIYFHKFKRKKNKFWHFIRPTKETEIINDQPCIYSYGNIRRHVITLHQSCQVIWTHLSIMNLQLLSLTLSVTETDSFPSIYVPSFMKLVQYLADSDISTSRIKNKVDIPFQWI